MTTIVFAAWGIAIATSQVQVQLIPGTPMSKADAAAFAAAMAQMEGMEGGDGAIDQDPGAMQMGNDPNAPAGPAGPPLSPEQLGDLRRLYNSSSNAERETLRAYFEAMKINLAKLLGGPGAQTQPDAPNLAQAVRSIEFTRTPQSVLTARSQIGFGNNTRPATNDFAAMAKWLQLQVLAGEWATLGEALKSLPADDAIAAYTQILQTINKSERGGDPNRRPDPGLLPEEVLAIADTAPEPLSDWQVAILAQLLKDASGKYSVARMLEQLESGTQMFGRQDAVRRERTVSLLLAADMAAEASKYFPSLDEARASLDAAALYNHALYHEAFANGPQAGDAAEDHLRTAWELYCETALIGSAEVKTRFNAMRHAIDLLPQMPPAQASAWLKHVFANPALAPAALEILALKAITLDQANLDEGARMQTIITMKEAVDTLLKQSTLDKEVLRVPLRMLTTAVLGEADTLLGGGGGGGRGGRPRMGMGGPAGQQQMVLLLRAMPDSRWLEFVEPSLASRAYRTSVDVATAAQEVDVALDFLTDAVERFPEQARALADVFLQRWIAQLGSSATDVFEDGMFIGYVRGDMGGAPLTRGRQRRNLAHLARLMLVLDELGIDSQQLPSIAQAFAACHGRTEVFTREGITAIFGPLDEIPAATAASLASQMSKGLAGEWRDRRAQQAAGMRRTPKEIIDMVERGYALAIELVDHSIADRPDSWAYSVIKAGLAIDRVQFKQEQDKSDFAAYNQYRKEAFEAFAQTAARYSDRVAQGNQRDDPGVYLAWFNAAVGSTELNYLTREDLLVEGSPQDDQIDLIRKAIESLGSEASQRHIALFAQILNDALPSLAPEVKPRIVRHSMRIIGNHPAGAPMRRLLELHQDLLKDEVKVRLTVDGDDAVGTNLLFGVTLTLRFTPEVDRETGGFSKYLMNDIWARVGNTYKPMNYRDLLKKGLEESFGDHFSLETIGFFEAFAPPTPIKESGAEGWLEKPVAYLVLKARDASVDRIPAVSMDMHFNDQAGAVVLSLMSNSPPIDAAHSSEPRPSQNLEVAQTIDLREVTEGRGEKRAILEVHARAEGLVPNLAELLPGYASALPGYEVSAKGIEERPLTLLEAQTKSSPYFVGMPQQSTDHEYIKPDASGFYRLPVERSWIITYTPTGAAVGSTFTFPTLGSGLDGKLSKREFADMDIVAVTGTTVAVTPPVLSARNLTIAGIAIVGIGGVTFVMRRRNARRRAQAAAVTSAHSAMPTHVTPLSVITALRRVREERNGALSATDHDRLTSEITQLERDYFGPASTTDGQQRLDETLSRWLRSDSAR